MISRDDCDEHSDDIQKTIRMSPTYQYSEAGQDIGLAWDGPLIAIPGLRSNTCKGKFQPTSTGYI